MKADSDLKRDVEAELRWAPDLDQTDVAAKVNGGVVSLTGYVASYAQRCAAEAAVKRVAGVTGIANDLAVRAVLGAIPTDPQIARDAVAALRSELPLIWEQLRPVVHEGHVALEGSVEWHYERERAEAVVRRVHGVVSVRNSIRLSPRLVPADVKEKILAAFARSAAIDAGHITVEAEGNEVTLRGEVRSWAERDEAQQTAWRAPGVAEVKNEITVRV
ncbi:MAG TPA: BON domain-containing protein [Steroidobacteraceae bacterium]|nr:BON domain-containing protein [Steroidobacteraceae bacterium]